MFMHIFSARGRRLGRLIAGLLAALMLSGVAVASPASAHVPGVPKIDWHQLSNTPDSDNIRVRAALGNPDFFMFQLNTPDNITWWKQIQFVDADGNVLAQDWTQDAKHHSKTLVIRKEDLDGATLVFWKAKAFGVHMPMFQLVESGVKSGDPEL